MEYCKNISLEPIQYINANGVLCIEKFVDIKKYKGYYQISDLGRVKSLKRTASSACFFDRILKSRIYKNDYECAPLSKNGKIKSVYIHKLVAEAFVENTNCKPKVNHKDLNKRNNMAENLEWTTQRENVVHYNLTKNTSSKYTGVSWSKARNKWIAHISHKGISKYLGGFISEIDASIAYISYRNNMILN